LNIALKMSNDQWFLLKRMIFETCIQHAEIRKAERQKDWKTERLKDWKAERLKGWKAERQNGRMEKWWSSWEFQDLTLPADGFRIHDNVHHQRLINDTEWTEIGRASCRERVW
jgi:hypothetical protein